MWFVILWGYYQEASMDAKLTQDSDKQEAPLVVCPSTAVAKFSHIFLQ